MTTTRTFHGSPHLLLQRGVEPINKTHARSARKPVRANLLMRCCASSSYAVPYLVPESPPSEPELAGGTRQPRLRVAGEQRFAEIQPSYADKAAHNHGIPLMHTAPNDRRLGLQTSTDPRWRSKGARRDCGPSAGTSQTLRAQNQPSKPFGNSQHYTPTDSERLDSWSGASGRTKPRVKNKIKFILPMTCKSCRTAHELLNPVDASPRLASHCQTHEIHNTCKHRFGHRDNKSQGFVNEAQKQARANTFRSKAPEEQRATCNEICSIIKTPTALKPI